MNRLSNIPVSYWYFFSVAYCYAVWNPYYSIFDLAHSNVDPAFKAIAIVLALIILAMYLVEGHRSLSIVGIVLFLALTGSIMWLAFNQGARFAYADFWGQWVVGALMTFALQGGRIYRSITGRVPVTADTHHDQGMHHHN